MPVTTIATEAVAQMDSVFQIRRDQVPVLAQRAEAEGVSAIRSPEDMVRLLFPHTTYKSYPEVLVTKGRWDQLTRWLDSLSAQRVTGVDLSGVEDLDGWIDRLEAAGHLVSASSGTSGKGSFLHKTGRDRATSLQNLVDCLTGIGLPPAPEWNVVPVGPDTAISHNIAIRDMILERYSRPDGITAPPGPPPTGHHRYMARLTAMRRAMADGTARPDEVAAFEAEAAERQARTEERLGYLAERIVERRGEKMFFNATFPLLYRLCQILTERGVGPGQITGDNAMTTGGGLKGIALPEDYQERIFGTLNIDRSRFLHYYSMQELNVRMPKCLEGRYHVPSTLVLLVLDADGEALAPVSDGHAEGRAAYFDLTVDGRWGGTMSGDRILADFGTCPCGQPGPTIHDQITRYSNLPDGDKITCAGTMDAYVRGFVED